ncbi:MAG: polyphenol oxidase family protein [Candidatus Omnitrophica bacterium]|nr:polyphenol oxidase family protein [Candidatus Omnitrophota bacterium]
MAAAVTESSSLQERAPGFWVLNGWGPAWVMAGAAGRSADLAELKDALPTARGFAQAEQVHGSSMAVIQHVVDEAHPVAGCDAMLTSLPRMPLVIRTADCLPLMLVDPVRRAIGIAHAGWRGLAAGLPLKLLAAFRHTFQSRPEDLLVAIGPAIHPCCYEVGPEFERSFGPFVQLRGSRRTCDLIGAAIDQFRRGRVAPLHIIDSQQCTACTGSPWYSIRREGQTTGRLLSFIVIR